MDTTRYDRSRNRAVEEIATSLHAILRERILLAIMMKRIAIYVLTFAVVLATMVRAIPHADAMSLQPDVAMQMAGMAGGQQPMTPCKGLTPTCIDSLDCMINLAVPVAPPPTPVSFRWAAVSYSLMVTPLTGVSTEPELSPPILRA